MDAGGDATHGLNTEVIGQFTWHYDSALISLLLLLLMLLLLLLLQLLLLLPPPPPPPLRSHRKMQRFWVWLSQPRLYAAMAADGFSELHIDFWQIHCLKKIVAGDVVFHYPMVLQ